VGVDGRRWRRLADNPRLERAGAVQHLPSPCLLPLPGVAGVALLLRARLATCLVVAALASGCGGGDFDPEGSPRGVLYEILFDPTPIGLNPDGERAQPLAVRFGDQAWGRVVHVIPSPLPEPLDQGDECRSGQKITIRLSSAEEIEYGPCRRLKELEPLRLVLLRMVNERDRP
jgi:hypothetical protein